METALGNRAEAWLREKGFVNWKKVHYQRANVKLVEQAIAQGVCRAKIAANGALRIRDEPSMEGRPIRRGRSPMDKFIVKSEITTRPGKEIFFGDVNHPMEEETFDHLFEMTLAYMQQRELWVRDSFAGAMPGYRIPFRFVTGAAWMSLFAKTLFIPPTDEELEVFEPEWTVINSHDIYFRNKLDRINSDAFVAISFKEKICIIGGLHYGGEIKKSVFTIMNYIMPTQYDVFPMHCSSNTDMAEHNACIFFGLSGTGKSTLSSDFRRRFLGDDQHGWVDGRIFNFEGGCYPKIFNLNEKDEPEIYRAIRFGSIIENMPLHDDREVDYEDDSLTENLRATYPVTHIPNAILKGYAKGPKNVIMLTTDVFGVIPPISRLTNEQAMYHFLSGFTSKMAGTETEDNDLKEPQPTFSTCFGAPFMPLHPTKYAKMLAKMLEDSQAKVWLVNTGWIGGTPAMGAKRISLTNTRAMIMAITENKLDDALFELDPVWQTQIPTNVPFVPDNLLHPESMWKDKEAYRQQIQTLVQMFQENFQQYHDLVDDKIIQSGPRLVE